MKIDNAEIIILILFVVSYTYINILYLTVLFVCVYCFYSTIDRPLKCSENGMYVVETNNNVNHVQNIIINKEGIKNVYYGSI